MKKFIAALLGLLFLFSFIIGLELEQVVHATSVNQTDKSSQLTVGADQLQITSIMTYSLYLPIVLGPPPLNPKKGIGIKAPPACDDLTALNASWYLNWRPNADSTCENTEKSKFIPRLSNKFILQNQLPLAIENAKISGWLIGFTEPNRPAPFDNMSPQEAATLWRQIEVAADNAGGIKLVSPSPYESRPNGGASQWLWAMVDAYRAKYGKNPRFDAFGWNIYGCTNHPNCYDVNDMKNYLTARRNEALQRGYNGPIWLVEFGGCLTSNSAASDEKVMREMSTWFNETSWIGRYAWFSNRRANSFQGDHNCVLVNDDGTLTKLGYVYKTY